MSPVPARPTGQRFRIGPASARRARDFAYGFFAVCGLLFLELLLLGVVRLSGMMSDGSFQTLSMLLLIPTFPAAGAAALAGVVLTVIAARDRLLITISALVVLFAIVAPVTMDAKWAGAAALMNASAIPAGIAAVAGPAWWFLVGRRRRASGPPPGATHDESRPAE